MNSTSVPERTGLSQIIGFFINSSLLYYLSCCLLLLGAYLMMHSPWLSAGFLMQYCEIYGIFLSYVIVLAGLCLLLFRRLALAEDGLVVAGIVLLLALDPAFFNNVFYTHSLRAGLVVNSFGFVLGVTLYATLKKFAGIPWTKASTTTTALAAVFVYYYPLGLNTLHVESTKRGYFYLLWWMPLLLAIFFERPICNPLVSTPAGGEQPQHQSSRTVISQRLAQRFRVASMLIVFYVVLCHLLAANYAYSLDFHPEYLTPIFLAVGLLHFKLNPPLGRKDQQFLWICAVLAVCCSGAAKEHSTIHLPWGIVLFPFHYGFGGAGVLLLYFWKTYRHRSWAMAATICLACAASGSSLSNSLFNICHFHFVPFAFFAVAFTVSFIIERSWIFPALAGECVLISILSLSPIQDHNKLVIFLQAGAAWFGVVHRYFCRSTHQRVYSLIGVFVLSLPSLMWCVSLDHLAWGADYFITVTGLFFAARFLENSFLSTLAVFGVLGGTLYLARNQLASVATEFRRAINFGLLVTILAFLILPLAFFLSVLRVRRRKHAGVNKQLLPEESNS